MALRIVLEHQSGIGVAPDGTGATIPASSLADDAPHRLARVSWRSSRLFRQDSSADAPTRGRDRSSDEMQCIVERER